MGLMASWAEAILMGLVSGLVFLHLSKTASGIRDREGALYIGASLQGEGVQALLSQPSGQRLKDYSSVSNIAYLFLLFETYRLTGVEINLFDRERGEGIVEAIPWLISRRLARALLEDIGAPFLDLTSYPFVDLLLLLVVPFVFTFIFYFLCGFDANAVQFFTFFAVVLLNHFIAVSFATFCAAASRDFTSATLIANTIFTLQSFSCGFFIQANTIPGLLFLHHFPVCDYTSLLSVVSIHAVAEILVQHSKATKI